MEQQNNVMRLKGCCMKMILGEDCLLVAARKIFAMMVMVVVAVVF